MTGVTKVVSLHGHTISTSVEPVAELIEMLEALLAEAKSGELQGIAYAGIYHNADVRTDWTGNVGGMATLGSVSLLSYELSQAIDETD